MAIHRPLHQCLTFTHLFTHSYTIIDGFINPFTHRRQSRPLSWSGAVRVRRLAQGHLDTQLGGAGDQTSNLLVTSQPALHPELLPPTNLQAHVLFTLTYALHRFQAGLAMVRPFTIAPPIWCGFDLMTDDTGLI